MCSTQKRPRRSFRRINYNLMADDDMAETINVVIQSGLASSKTAKSDRKSHETSKARRRLREGIPPAHLAHHRKILIPIIPHIPQIGLNSPPKPRRIPTFDLPTSVP